MSELPRVEPDDRCTICSCLIADNPNTQYVKGHFGATPVVFCYKCYDMILEMAAAEFGLELDEEYEVDPSKLN